MTKNLNNRRAARDPRKACADQGLTLSRGDDPRQADFGLDGTDEALTGGAPRGEGASAPVGLPDAIPAGRVATAQRDPPLAYAALDLGTNNCRLLVATPRERGFRVVDAFSRIVRLGEGIAANGSLSEAAMARAIAALKVCGAKLAERGVKRARLIATEACRVASNGARVRRARPGGNRPQPGDRLAGDRGEAGGRGLRVAGRPDRVGRHPVRHRWRLVGAGVDRSCGAGRRPPPAHVGPRAQLGLAPRGRGERQRASRQQRGRLRRDGRRRSMGF